MPEQDPVILVLDDEPIVTITVKNYFDLKGLYRVVAFNRPLEALDYLKTQPVDLIISDQMMPGMNGLEFFQHVKEIQPEAIRVLLTGYAQKDDAIRAINEIGIYQYIEKPWSNDDLDLIVRNGLERKRLYDSLQKRISDLRIAGDEIARLKNGLVQLYLEKSAPSAPEELRKIVGSEIRSGTRRLLYAFVSVSVLLLASISYIVYSTFFSIRRETSRLRIQLTEIKRSQLDEKEIRRLRAAMAGAPSEQIIAEYEESVCLIQGSFIFRDRESKKILRMASRGERGSAGAVDLSVDASGPPLETSFTGTGFLVTSGGKVLTNRHVAEPWWSDKQAEEFVRAGFRPELRFIAAYFPHRQQPFTVKARKVSSDADIALIEVSPVENLPKPTPLEDAARGAVAGAPVVLIAFPLGLEAILARATERELGEISGLPNMSPEQVGRVLAKRDLVRPLINQGHLSSVTEELVVYDAATTFGGSGGPVFNSDGKVIAINFAVIPEFTGASMGVRIRRALELMKD